MPEGARVAARLLRRVTLATSINNRRILARSIGSIMGHRLGTLAVLEQITHDS